jgi:outer membrane immunogenic protein
MKKCLIGAAALIAFTAPALAADLAARPYTKAPIYKAPEAIYNWTGFYIGGHLGGVFGSRSSGGFMGGVQAGADYQFAPNWVVGGEVQFSGIAGDKTNLLFPGNVMVTRKMNELGSVTGRVGYTFGPALIYAKGGFAFRDNYNTAVTMAGVPQAFTTTGNQTAGYTVGTGVEYIFAPSWSVKGEYQYYNFGTTTFTAGPAALVGTRLRNDDHSVKVGVNYRFGWGGNMFNVP